MPINPKDVRRQAVVIIHGMGEQRPNSTIRGFTRCLLGELHSQTNRLPKSYEKPDKISGTFETRSKTILKDDLAGRPTTHVYEFYWAHHMRDTKGSQVWRWVLRLLFWKPRCVPPRLKKVFWTLWGLVVLGLALGIAIAVNYWDFGTKWRIISGISWVGALWGAIRGILNPLILNTLGDAARYMSDNPDNIEQRQKIRQEGVDLLRRLHEAVDELGQPLFDRVVVASHSLGTVVAYDLLRLAWVQYSETFDNKVPPFVNGALKTMEADGFEPGADYPDLQHACWSAQREAGNRWRVTDFVTMGAPLAYFEYLIVGSGKEFRQRVDEREYPTCPPVKDPKYALHWSTSRPGYTQKIDLLSYHALFACIRWTNLYFATDFIGGPLKPVLGQGICDVEVPVPWRRLKELLPYPFGHTDYWSDGESDYYAMDKITEALKLNC